MAQDVTIRTATMKHFAAVGRRFHELDEHHARIRPDVFQPFDGPARSREPVSRFVTEEDAELLVAAAAAEIVGLATVRAGGAPGGPMLRARPWFISARPRSAPAGRLSNP